MIELEDLKGEIVLMIEGYNKKEIVLDFYQIKDMVDEYIGQGMRSKDAIKQVSKDCGIAKNDVYREYHNLKS